MAQDAAATPALPPVAILCGGKATRLRPITETIPKALVEVGGRPFLHYQLEQLKRQGLEKVVLCIGYKGEMVEEAIGDGANFGLDIQYSHDGEHFLGTGGALFNARHLLADVFFVLYGDSYLRVDYRLAYTTFLASQKRGLMTVFRNDGKWDSSNVEYSDGQLVAYSKTEKTPRMQYIDYGMGILTTSALPDDGGEFDLADLYERLAREGEMAALEVSERFYEIGSHSGLEEFRGWLASNGERVGAHS